MASSINTNLPASGNATTSGERAQKVVIKSEIEALQGGTGLGSNVVTNAKLATMVPSTFKCRVTASTGSPEDGTAAQVRAILDPVPILETTVTGTTHTLLMASKGKTVRVTNAAGCTITVETSTATWAAGDRVDLLNGSTGGNLTVTGSGVTIRKKSDQTQVIAPWGGATLHFVSDSTVIMVGGMEAA